MRNKAFSLVEVVVAVGIFAISIVGVIGLLAPTSKSINDVRDADDASRVVSVIQAQLQQAGFTAVKIVLDVNGVNYIYFASINGGKLGVAGDKTVWGDPVDNSLKFFEIALTRNTALSPASNDASSGYLAFTISLRWPAYLPNGTQFTADAQKSVLISPAAITR